jgi:hypothetical protein
MRMERFHGSVPLGPVGHDLLNRINHRLAGANAREVLIGRSAAFAAFETGQVDAETLRAAAASVDAIPPTVWRATHDAARGVVIGPDARGMNAAERKGGQRLAAAADCFAIADPVQRVQAMLHSLRARLATEQHRQP